MPSLIRDAVRAALNRGASAERERGRHLSARQRVSLALRRGLRERIKVCDARGAYIFECSTAEELYRARTMMEKEPGTNRWLDRDIRPGDIVYDIGANIGVYTLFAGRRIGETGRVIAFEPHVPTFHSLLRNVRENQLQDRVVALSCALHARDGFLAFNYRELTPGSSDSQVAITRTAKGRRFEPVGGEIKYCACVDSLVRREVVPPPDLVKIDVDGNELPILKGMKRLLAGSDAPRALQVEVNRRGSKLVAFLRGHGFTLVDRHYTIYQERKVGAGMDPEEVGYNGIFRRGT